jgi:Zn-dependent M28 family amino/carboxypeptidase
MPKMIAGPAPVGVPVLWIRTDLHQRMIAAAAHGNASLRASVPIRTVEVTGANLHATFTSPSGAAVRVLLVAHYDGVGDDPEVRLPAAADNASGVAVVIEAARLLAPVLPPGVGLEVALLDGEEIGATGSARHAPSVPPGTFVLNLDGAAALHGAAVIEAGGPAHGLLAALDRAGRDTGVPLRAGAMPSDNRRYAAVGLPSIGIGMGIPGYQTPAETADRVDARTMDAAARLLTGTVWHLTN